MYDKVGAAMTSGTRAIDDVMFTRTINDVTEFPNTTIVSPLVEYIIPAAYPLLSLVIAALFIIESILSVLLNGFTIVTIVTHPSMHTRVNMVVVNLNAADFVLGLSLSYNACFFLIPQLTLSRAACLTRTAVFYLSCICSGLSLILVTVDRYVAIVYPYRYHQHGALPKLWLFICAVWVYSLLFGMGVIVWGRWPAPSCSPDVIIPAGLYFPFVATISYAGCIAMSLMYTKIFVEAAKQDKRLAEVERFKATFVVTSTSPAAASSSPSPLAVDARTDITPNQMVSASQMKKERKYVKAIFIVVVAFMTCWLPITSIIGALIGGAPSTPTMYYVRTIASVVYATNSLINPVVYIFKIPEFNAHFRRLLAACCCTKAFKTRIQPSSYPHSVETSADVA